MDAFARVRADRQPQLVTLVGVPGIGKSQAGATSSSCDRATSSRADLLAAGPLASLRRGSDVLGAERDGQGARRHPRDRLGARWPRTKLDLSVRTASSTTTGTRTGSSARLRPLVGLGSDQELSEDQRSESFAAWRRFFEALAERSPLVLVFEDLQWADEGLLDFVDYLVEWVERPAALRGRDGASRAARAAARLGRRQGQRGHRPAAGPVRGRHGASRLGAARAGGAPGGDAGRPARARGRQSALRAGVHPDARRPPLPAPGRSAGRSTRASRCRCPSRSRE